jgi:hypothetical protein
MAKLRSKETKQQKLAAIIRRTNRCLYNSRCTKVPHSLNRILSVYTKWSTAGFNGASQDFQQLKWTEPLSPQNCISADGIGHVYVIINLKTTTWYLCWLDSEEHHEKILRACI